MLACAGLNAMAVARETVPVLIVSMFGWARRARLMLRVAAV